MAEDDLIRGSADEQEELYQETQDTPAAEETQEFRQQKLSIERQLPTTTSPPVRSVTQPTPKKTGISKFSNTGKIIENPTPTFDVNAFAVTIPEDTRPVIIETENNTISSGPTGPTGAIGRRGPRGPQGRAGSQGPEGPCCTGPDLTVDETGLTLYGYTLGIDPDAIVAVAGISVGSITADILHVADQIKFPNGMTAASVVTTVNGVSGDVTLVDLVGVATFNGVAGDVQGVSTFNGATGGITSSNLILHVAGLSSDGGITVGSDIQFGGNHDILNSSGDPIFRLEGGRNVKIGDADGAGNANSINIRDTHNSILMNTTELRFTEGITLYSAGGSNTTTNFKQGDDVTYLQGSTMGVYLPSGLSADGGVTFGSINTGGGLQVDGNIHTNGGISADGGISGAALQVDGLISGGNGINLSAGNLEMVNGSRMGNATNGQFRVATNELQLLPNGDTTNAFFVTSTLHKHNKITHFAEGISADDGSTFGAALQVDGNIHTDGGISADGGISGGHIHCGTLTSDGAINGTVITASSYFSGTLIGNATNSLACSGAAATATTATNVAVSGVSDDVDYKVVITQHPGSGTSSLAAKTDSGSGADGLVYNPSTDLLSLGGISAGSGVTLNAGLHVTGGSTFGSAINFQDNQLERPKFKDYAETVNAIGTITGNTAIDFSAGNVQTVTGNGNCEFSFTNPPATGNAGTLTLLITNGGANTTTWASAVKWPGNVAPTLTTSGIDILSFVTIDAGSNIYGFVGGINFS